MNLKDGVYKPKVVLFDLGGVLLDIDYGLTQAAFKEIGVPDVHTLYSQAAQSDLFDEMERGRISPAQFRDGLRRLIGKKVMDEKLDHAWNALIQTLPAPRLEFVHQLKVEYTTALLSNTNEIHITCFENVIDETLGLERFRTAFHHLFYSSRIDARKPDKEAFTHVLSSIGVSAEEVLFIDDSEQHVVASRAMGIQAILLEKGQEISRELSWLLDPAQ